jgi:hypothetical protein
VKKRRALVWVLAAAGALAAFATVAALLPPPREPIEDDLAALAKKYGLKKADPPAWTRLDHSELDYSAAPTERYVAARSRAAAWEGLLADSHMLFGRNLFVSTWGVGYVPGHGAEDADRVLASTSVRRSVYDWGTLVVEATYAQREDGTGTITLTYAARKKTLAQRVRDWWRGVRGGP